MKSNKIKSIIVVFLFISNLLFIAAHFSFTIFNNVDIVFMFGIRVENLLIDITIFIAIILQLLTIILLINL